MDDGRPHMWTHFIMENEMTTIEAPPLFEGSLSSMVVAPTLLQYQLSNGVIRKKKRMMKQMLEGDGVILLLLTSSIYMKRSGGVLTNLICHSNIGHTFAPNTMVNY